MRLVGENVVISSIPHYQRHGIDVAIYYFDNLVRYLFVRWRLNVTNMYVILGETGDTDYEELIAGTHKTLIMKGAVEKGSEELLRTSGSYLREDIVPQESSLVARISGDARAEEIVNALRQVSRAGM